MNRTQSGLKRVENIQSHKPRCILEFGGFLVFCFILLFANKGFAQSLNLKNDFNSSPLADQIFEIYAEAIPNEIKNGETFRLKLWGRVAEGYHIYSIKSQGQFAPEPTQMIVASESISAASPLNESDTVIVYDEAFKEQLRVHKHDFWLEQIFRVSMPAKGGSYEVKGDLIYQLCSQRVCSLPLSKPFLTKLKVIAAN